MRSELCSVSSRVEPDRQRESRVVGAGVVVRRAADESLRAQSRLGGKHGRRAHWAMPADIPEQRQRVVKSQSGGELPQRYARAAIDRPGELERVNEMWREA